MRALFLLSLMGLCACQTNQRERPVDKVNFSTPQLWAAAQEGQHARISTGWLNEFSSSRMSKLVNEALKNNPNLKATASQMRIAKENTIIGRAARLASVSASSSVSTRDSQQSSRSESYSLSLNTRWEVDLWGRLRDSEAQNLASYQAQLADYRGARLSLAANTARSWCNLVTAERQLELAINTLDSYSRALPAVERGYLATTLRAVDLQFARNNIVNAKRTIESRKRSRDEAARVLELLLGRYPSATVGSSTQLPTLSKNVPTGLPSQLLSRRPDLVEAQANILASAYGAENARKNLLPSLNLSGGLSNNGPTLSRVLDPNFIAYSVAASLAQSVYQGGRLNAQSRIALERNKTAISNYTNVALRAFREVESALAAETSLREQERLLAQEVEQTNRAETRTLRDITLGIPGASFLEYLEAQRRAESARASLIQLRNSRLLNRIDLHLALGGDFKTNTP